MVPVIAVAWPAAISAGVYAFAAGSLVEGAVIVGGGVAGFAAGYTPVVTVNHLAKKGDIELSF